MTNTKATFGWRWAVLAAVLIVAIGAAEASASSAPIVITYQKTCVLTATPTCTGTTGDGDTLTMQITGFRPTGKAPHLTFTESIVGEVNFTAVMNGHASPAGFIVLNGTITGGPFTGAQVHQRSNLVNQINETMSTWEGELRIMPGSG